MTKSISKRFIKSLGTLAIKVFRENCSILLVVFFYSTSGWLVKHILDHGAMRGNTLGLGYLSGYIPPVFALIFLTKIFPRFKEGFSGLGMVCKDIRESHFNMEALVNLILILSVIPIFLLSFHTFKIAIPAFHPFSWDTFLMQSDFAVHLGHHPWSLVQPILGYPWITQAISYCYHHVWGGVLITMVFWMAWSPRRQLRKQFFLSFLLTWIILGTILATIFSSAGPCYFDKVTPTQNPYVPLMIYLNSIPGLEVLQTQEILWELHARKTAIFYTGISAMPSLHVAAAILCALVGWQLNRVTGLILGLFSVLIQLGAVHLGWHYAVDGYLSALLTLLIWKGIGRMVKVPEPALVSKAEEGD